MILPDRILLLFIVSCILGNNNKYVIVYLTCFHNYSYISVVSELAWVILVRMGKKIEWLKTADSLDISMSTLASDKLSVQTD